MRIFLRLVIGVLLVGCASPQPPSRTPDFVGLVISVEVAVGGGGHFVVELAPAAPNAFPTLMPGPGRSAVRADVVVSSEVLSLARQGDGTYRHSAPAPTWEGHPVQVWVAHPMSVPQDSSFEAEASTVVVDMPTKSGAP